MLTVYLTILFASLALSQETFTDSACRAQTTAIAACASRWDSIRTECKSSVSTNTIWPGPCECAYYANDLPCFDEHAFCAAQVWTQVPQWFRDGVSSCLMKDAGYTIRAALGSATGSLGNPFTVVGLAGRATRTSSGSVMGSGTAEPGAGMARATGVPVQDEGLSVGAKAGFGVGIGVGVILTAVVALLVVRRKRKNVQAMEDAEKIRGKMLVELNDDDAHIHHIASKTVYPSTEMPGDLAQRHELGIRASTWLVELPVANSHRTSRQMRI
ncbi:hypothetical protein EK21DRAFT_100843 [Setomelanomma holmii]|uniref:Uncharacterized protein n=1 Tax=Setomelanomma holmii TaxID=210430 RepID=A0A9P4H7Z6_9PLEO|nr:hypothetical protein EK21DRAFT_100843 [Setomelanomma holmii]